jgi:TolA-binding protein
MSSRLVSSLLGSLLVAGLASSVSAQTPAPSEQASKLAEEGKGLSAEGKHAEASEKFRQAVVLSPDGKFYLYLCISLSKEGKLGEAINACDAVERNGADEKTLAKTQQMTESLRTTMKQQGMDPDKALADGRAQNAGEQPGGGASPGGGGDSSVAVPPAQPQYVGAPPVSVYGAAAPPNEYTWSLGATLYGAGTAIGKDGAYAEAGGGLRLHADYIAVPSLKIGAQAFLGVTSVAGEDMYNDLTIVDFGLAGFKHICVSRVCITPLAGLMLSGMQPSYEDGTEDSSVNMFSVGARLEGAASLALGSRYEHVLSATLGANVYSAAVGDYEEDPEFFGLDEPSTAVYFGLGYTYRFNTPLGQSPFITFD